MLPCVQEVVTPLYIVSYYIKWGNYFLDARYLKDIFIDSRVILKPTLESLWSKLINDTHSSNSALLPIPFVIHNTQDKLRGQNKSM